MAIRLLIFIFLRSGFFLIDPAKSSTSINFYLKAERLHITELSVLTSGSKVPEITGESASCRLSTQLHSVTHSYKPHSSSSQDCCNITAVEYSRESSFPLLETVAKKLRVMIRRVLLWAQARVLLLQAYPEVS